MNVAIIKKIEEVKIVTNDKDCLIPLLHSVIETVDCLARALVPTVYNSDTHEWEVEDIDEATDDLSVALDELKKNLKNYEDVIRR